MNGTASAALVVGIGLVVGSIAPVRAETPGELVEEFWESAQVEGTRIGFVHTTVRKREVEGVQRLHAAAELDLTLRRHNAVLHIRREQGTEETPEGKVLGVFMRQSQDGGGRLELTGAVEDGRLHVRVDNGRIERRIRWKDEVVGLYRLEHLFQERKPKPGDSFAFFRYEPTYNTVLTIRGTVKERENVSASTGKPSARLLRVEMTADKLEARGGSVQPPPVVWWLDDHFVPVRRQIELDGLGTVILTRTSRDAATAPATPGRLGDIGLKTLIPLNRNMPHPYATRSAVYRIALRGDPDLGSALASDAHQEVRNRKDDTFELYVHPVIKPERRGNAEVGPAVFLQPCHFINCDDPRVKELARRAAGDETDSWRKARRLERWVKQNMRPDNAVPLGPAGEVARQLCGDCRQYALLTAALCRAEGIPARTAVGLLYVEKGRRPFMGFHMWTEVWIDGQWLGLDGTLGQGGVSAAHLKIADHSWHDTHSLTPLLPVNRVLGKMAITLLSSEGGD